MASPGRGAPGWALWMDPQPLVGPEGVPSLGRHVGAHMPREGKKEELDMTDEMKTSSFVKGQAYLAKGGKFEVKGGVRVSWEARTKTACQGDIPEGTLLRFEGLLSKDERVEGRHALKMVDTEGVVYHLHPNHLKVHTKYNDSIKSLAGKLEAGAPVHMVEDDELVELRAQVEAAKKAKADEAIKAQVAAEKAKLRAELEELTKAKAEIKAIEASGEKASEEETDQADAAPADEK